MSTMLTIPNVPALAKASDRVVNRLYASAIVAVAREVGKDRLSVEDTVTEARGAITDLYRNEFYFGHIQRLVADLAATHGRLITKAQEAKPPINDPITRKVRDPKFVRETSETMREMVDVAWEDLGKRNVSREAVKLFIDVIEEAKRQYLRERFDPADIIEPGVLALARAVYGDFETHAATMNMQL